MSENSLTIQPMSDPYRHSRRPVSGEAIDLSAPCDVGVDGYCTTHGVVGCKVGKPKRADSLGQFARIEAKLNAIMRRLGMDADD